MNSQDLLLLSISGATAAFALGEGYREGLTYRYKHATKHALVTTDKDLKVVNATTFLIFILSLCATAMHTVPTAWCIIPLQLTLRKILLDGVLNKMINPNFSFFRVSRSKRSTIDNAFLFVSDRIPILSPKILKLAILSASILFAIFTR